MSAFSAAEIGGSPFVNTRIVYDENKGRCLEWTGAQNAVAGQVLFVEEALVYGSYDEDEEILPHVNEDLLLRAFGKRVLNEMNHLCNELSCLEKVGCVDTARNFMQLVAITHLKEQLLSSSDSAIAYQSAVSLKG